MSILDGTVYVPDGQRAWRAMALEFFTAGQPSEGLVSLRHCPPGGFFVFRDQLHQCVLIGRGGGIEVCPIELEGTEDGGRKLQALPSTKLTRDTLVQPVYPCTLDQHSLDDVVDNVQVYLTQRRMESM